MTPDAPGSGPRPQGGCGSPPTVWRGGHLVLPDRVVDDRVLMTVDGRIEALARDADVVADVPRRDLAGAYVLPGLVDLHTHGALGCSFLGGDDTAFATILAAQARHGVTGVLATTSTATMDGILATLARVRAWSRGGAGEGAFVAPPHGAFAATRAGARLLGAHVEGPYFAAAQAGAQDPAHLRTPDDGSADDLLAYADVVRMVSFAPELPGAERLTCRLVAAGIVAAAGHSDGRDADLARCEALGLRHVIHLWSGQSTTVREGPWRRPGLLEASLASDTLTGEMIGDGKHLPPTLMRLAWKAFGPDRLCLVSDAVAGAGLPERSPFTLGGMTYEVRDGVGMVQDGSAFAGSTTFLDGMLRVAVHDLGVPLPDAVRAASRTPARVLGLDERLGSLTPGRDADLVVCDRDLIPLETLVAGRTVACGPEGACP